MRRLIAIAVVGVLLSGCSGEPEVLEPDPTDSPTASPAPTMPAQAREDSDEGAAAFVAHWIDVFNHAARTGDTETLRRMGPDCQACISYADTMEEEASQGNAPPGDVWAFQDALVEKAPDDTWDIAARIDARSSSGDETYTMGFVLQHSGNFSVDDLYIVEGLE